MFNPILRMRARIALWRSTCRGPFARPRGDPDSEIVRRLEAAIARMSPLTREVFMMHRFDDLGYERIAHRLDISIDEVERHMATAIWCLHRALRDMN